MQVWPNWIDLIIVTLFMTLCYNGFGRGFLGEIFYLVGAVVATTLTINYTGFLKGCIVKWIPFPPEKVAVVVFWLLFVILMLSMRWIIKRVSELMRWERLHWFIQGVGLFLGGVRALWWSGFILIVCASSGFSFFQESVEQKSVLGPRLFGISRGAFEQVSNRFPGAQYREETLVPPFDNLLR